MKLTQWEVRWAGAIGRAFVPPGVFGGLTEGRDVGAALADTIGRSPWYAAVLVRLALWVVWLAPPFALGRARTLGGLDEASREACLEALLDSKLYPVREMLKLLKMNVCLALVGDTAVLAHLGVYGLDRRHHGDDAVVAVRAGRPS